MKELRTQTTARVMVMLGVGLPLPTDAAERVHLLPLIRSVFPLAKAPEAIVAACDRAHAVKVQLNMMAD